MAHYLVEFRLHGYVKRYAKRLICEVARKFHVRGITRKKLVPHITLFGSFTTSDEERVVKAITEAARKHSKVPFKVKGFNYFKGKRSWFIGSHKGKVIYLDIEPSQELEELRREIAEKLTPFCKTRSYDHKKDFEFHAT